LYKFLCVLLCIVCLSVAVNGIAGTESPENHNSYAPFEGIHALTVDVDSVFLNVSVRENETNHSLGGLQKDDFTIYEDGIEQEVSQFLPTEAPFDLLLLIDVSGSTRPYIKMMKEAAIEFTRNINSNDRIAVATFNSKVRLVQNYTSDREAAEKAISKIKSGGGTAFYDALMTSITEYKRDTTRRNAVVVFTDGVDNSLEGVWGSGSKISFDELFRQIQESDTIVYTIFLNTEGDLSSSSKAASPNPSGWPGTILKGRNSGIFPFPFPFPGSSQGKRRPASKDDDENLDDVYRQAKNQLHRIAEQTGGRLYSPAKLDELSGMYSEIADDLRIQYQLGYNSSNQNNDGKWRKIRVKIANYPDAAVRTRQGYYARKSRSEVGAVDSK
jgi:VWFA-related protein